MPPVKGPCAQTTGSSGFHPDAFFEVWDKEARSLLPQDNDLRYSIITAFNLAQSDNYVYHATASVTLAQVQKAIEHGGDHNFHNWYPEDSGQASALPPPSLADINAYTSVFASTTSTSKSLIALAANAKKGSHRASVATYLHSRRNLPSIYTIPKLKKAHVNPYYDYWAWSCQNLEWAGPTADTVLVKQSHHILPVLMHHFGCVVPSYEGLEIIKQVTKGRKVLDLGSGNGYWTYMLRRLGLQVNAVDNLQSRYRSLWIGDTVVEDGEKYLKANKGARDALLLLVYPIVGSDFTARILKAYAGDTIFVAGTQNRNGYTAFSTKVMDEYVAAEKPEYRKTVQIPLPSFAGKDEALFVFERGDGSQQP
ncbi:MAG: hypothetical protein LQ343_005252 [Gyalolechia ehrenbergii]|nr:MAG: hypothetical protein LQ343_005252 [Gyalolechia ehrenbergii]